MKTDKAKTQSELRDILGEKKKEGKKIGFTNGCFDILHMGHIRYLSAAKMECDILIVGVNSDASAQSIKGDGRPVNTEWDRLEVLAALECVDFLTLFAEDTPQVLIEELTPDIVFKGGDWKEEDVVGADHVKKNGGEVRIIAYEEGYSTTNIIEKIRRMTEE